MAEATVPSTPIEVFISYSHRDENLRRALETHLSLLRRQGIISTWHDRKITAGTEWAGQIDEHLNRADVILLLISADFLASDYCYDIELKRAMERHEAGEARVVPVIVRPVDWRNTPFVKLQALPINGKPVTRWSDRDEAFQNIAEGIRTAAVAFSGGRSQTRAKSRHNNLPSQPDRFVGREQELDQGKQFLLQERARLLTLIGPGGTGKTRLAVELADEVSDRFDDGVYFVELTSIADPDLVVSSISRALGMDTRDTGDSRLVEALKEFLRDKHLLLVLDNFEQVLEAAPLVGTLLEAAPGLQVVTTSQWPLRIRGEQEFAVPPLSLPVDEALTAESVERSDAVRLFVARARLVQPEFDLTSENAAAVAAICHRLDGLPLAIELAAAQIRMLSPRAMSERLEQPLVLLSRGRRDLQPRMRTLREAITWSYNLLTREDQRLFQQLSVFVGGCTLEAIEAVCILPQDRDMDVFSGVGALVEKSLLRREASLDDEPRFRMLEILRHYAAERLSESGEAGATEWRYAQFFLRLADAALPDLVGSGQAKRLNQLEVEHANFRAALAWLVDGGDTDHALQLATALGQFWWSHGDYAEGWSRLMAVLALPGAQSPTVTRAQVLNAAGMLGIRLGRLSEARAAFDESLAIGRNAQDIRAVAAAAGNLALVALEQGDYSTARRLFDESLHLHHELRDSRGIAEAQDGLGVLATALGEYPTARDLLQESLAGYRAVRDTQGAAWVLNDLARLAIVQGELDLADRHATEALKVGQMINDREMIAWAHNYLGAAAARRGDVAAARAHHEVSISILTLLGDRRAIALCLEAFAGLSVDESKMEQALHLASVADTLREDASIPRTTAEETMLRPRLDHARAALGEAKAAAAYEAGRSMSWEQAVADARRG